MSALVTAVTAVSLILHSMGNSGSVVTGQRAGHYCTRDTSSPVQISGEAEGDIYTLYPGNSHYQNNQNCVWIIDAGPNNRVEFTVVSSSLQWAPEKAVCPGYDHVAIKDVQSTATSTGENGGEESIVLQWCGLSQPLGAVSSGRYVRVEFMSDKNNPYQYTGVHLHFKTFPSRECAPSWNDSSTGFCYKLLDKETDWSSAQKECNTGRANLASVLSENEHKFLLQTFGSLTKTAWIGLNDIVYQGDYKWIDNRPFNFSRFGKSHTANQYLRCVELQFRTEYWQLQNCEKYLSKPLCKSNRGSETAIFRIPQPRSDEGDSEPPVGRLIAIAVSVVVLIVLIIIGCFAYRRMKLRRKSGYKSHKRSNAETQEGTVGLGHRLQEVRPEHREPSAPVEERSEEFVMSSPESQMIAPPAYEEALSHPIVQPS